MKNGDYMLTSSTQTPDWLEPNIWDSRDVTLYQSEKVYKLMTHPMTLSPNSVFKNPCLRDLPSHPVDCKLPLQRATVWPLVGENKTTHSVPCGQKLNKIFKKKSFLKSQSCLGLLSMNCLSSLLGPCNKPFFAPNSDISFVWPHCA